jgi:ATP-dependent Clp protease ATP-binding subunit ClpC
MDYDKSLAEEGRDLTALCGSCRPTECVHRDWIIEQILASFSRRRSVLLVGPSGVGKTAIVHGVAHRLHLSNRLKVSELTTTTILTGTRFLGEWQTKAKAIVSAAMKQRRVLYFNDIWNLPSTGASSDDRSNFLDFVRAHLSAGRLLLLGEATPEIVQAMQRVAAFVTLFDVISVQPLEPAQIREIVLAKAARIHLDLDSRSCSRVLKVCSQFLQESPGPRPALQLLDQLKHYQGQKSGVGEREKVCPDVVDKVFSTYSGLPRFVVSESIKRPVGEVRHWFQDRIVGQREATEAIVETIALFKAGLRDPNKPIGSFLFVGPTGVGKTELARALAEYLFGSPTRLLRFDLSEFKDYRAFQMLVGDPDHPTKPSRLVDPVRGQPFQVVLFDELEKAHPNVWDLLLQILDEGRLTPPNGRTVNFRNTIIIATSNVGALEAVTPNIGFAAPAGSRFDFDKMRNALEQHFRPEFLNRFQFIVNFHALSLDQVTQIARREIKLVLNREGITERNLLVDIGPDSLDFVVRQGYQERYGARALKRQIQRLVVLPIAALLMERSVEPGSILKLEIRGSKLRVRVVDTDDSLAHRRQRQPVKADGGKRYSRTDLAQGLDQLEGSVAAISDGIDEPALRESLADLDRRRADPGFWHDTDAANAVILEAHLLQQTLSRLESLRDRLEDLKIRFGKASTRGDYVDVTTKLVRLREQTDSARRELVYLGRKGAQDAIVELLPIGPPGEAREFLYGIYVGWARSRDLQLIMLHEPLTSEEPIMIGVKGQYAYGYLAREAGLHRVREPEQTSVVRVSVAPWRDAISEVQVSEHRALKGIGELNGKIRSRLRVDQANPFVLQNGRTLTENLELAGQIADSWNCRQTTVDEIVRRYDLSPFQVKDYFTGIHVGKKDIVKPHSFHELLCQRVDLAAYQETQNTS